MNGPPPASICIPRGEEESIRRELRAVQADHISRAVLLYGEGGVGKTSLIRHMAETGSDNHTAWVSPIDVDDPVIWLLSNLERRVASQLDPGNRYFAEYYERLRRLPSATLAHI